MDTRNWVVAEYSPKPTKLNMKSFQEWLRLFLRDWGKWLIRHPAGFYGMPRLCDHLLLSQNLKNIFAEFILNPHNAASGFTAP